MAIGQHNPIKQSDLMRCWKYYPEESKFFPGKTVYRPCDYDSSPSKRVIRGRFKISFRANGECSYLQIGLNDIHVMKPGKWVFNTSTNTLEIFDLEMQSINKLKVARLEHQLLLIENN
jgi:hypothetical protein